MDIGALQAGDTARTEALRTAGGVLIGLAAIAIAFRKSLALDPWSDLALLAVVAIPALVLFGGGLAAAKSASLPRPWHAVWLVFGIILIYLSTVQLIEVVGGDYGAPLNVAWTFAVVAVASLIAAREAFVPFGWLAAGISAGVSVLALCEEALPDGIGTDLGTFRNVCMFVALGLLGAAFLAHRAGVADNEDGSELITAAGIYFVLGAAIAGISVLVVGATLSVAPASAPPVDRSAVPDPSAFWDAVLGLGSLALVVAGSMLEKRGPVYVGSAGLFIFVVIVGTDLDNPDRDGSLAGWPLVLTVLAALAIAGSAMVARRSAST